MKGDLLSSSNYILPLLRAQLFRLGASGVKTVEGGYRLKGIAD